MCHIHPYEARRSSQRTRQMRLLPGARDCASGEIDAGDTPTEAREIDAVRSGAAPDIQRMSRRQCVRPLDRLDDLWRGYAGIPWRATQGVEEREEESPQPQAAEPSHQHGAPPNAPFLLASLSALPL